MRTRTADRAEPVDLATLRAANDELSPDPLSIMTRALAGTDPDPPEAVFLAWLLSLPDQLDPATAALRLLVQREDDARSPDADPLLALLNETARWPKPRLERLRRKPRGVREARD